MKKIVREQLDKNELDSIFIKIYGKNNLEKKKRRCNKVLDGFKEIFGEEANHIFSAPGRTEIGGNHTDHQKGCVLAGSVNLDAVAAVAKNDLGIVRIQSEGYTLVSVPLDNLAPVPDEFGSTVALVRGILSAFSQRGCVFNQTGFDAYVTSDVFSGSGLSSSAAFEVLIGTIINHLYFDEKCNPIEIAKISQYAENVYFGKPCGLMDQVACSVGGVVSIDFSEEEPKVESIFLDFEDMNHALCILDSGVDHADLTDEYADITKEMASISEFFGKTHLSQVSKNEFFDALPELRKKAIGRAILRAMHFFKDTELAILEAEALKNKQYDLFLEQLTASGISSIQCLQNVCPTGETESQGLLLAITYAQSLLDGCGAIRVHGGGFAGTVQAFVPIEKVEKFRIGYEKVFGENTCNILSIRPVGGVCLA